MCLFQPIKDCLHHYSEGKDYKKQASENATAYMTASLIYGEHAGKHYAYGESIIKRMALAAVGTFALIGLSSGIGLTVGAVTIGAIVSLPTTLIAAGALGMYYGTVAIITSLATASFANLVLGLLSLAAGYFSIQHYMIKSFGILESYLAQKPPQLRNDLTYLNG